MAFHDAIESFIHELRYRQVIPYVRDGSVFVDLGCGRDYRFLRRIQDRAARCWGFDVRAPSRVEGNLTLLAHDITKPLPLGAGIADQVTILAVIEHLEKPIEIFRECQRILRVGGRVIATSPSRLGIKLHEALRRTRLVQDVEPGEHKDFGMSKQLLKTWMERTGLEVEALKTFELGINLLVVARKPSPLDQGPILF
jgi:SAM-dependent methyltransferase